MTITTTGGALPPAVVYARRPTVKTLMRTSDDLADLNARFDVFYPGFYAEFCDYAEPFRGEVGKLVGSQTLIERMRYESVLTGRDADGYAVNNDVAAYLARRWRRDNPASAHVLEIRLSSQGENRGFFLRYFGE